MTSNDWHDPRLGVLGSANGECERYTRPNPCLLVRPSALRLLEVVLLNTCADMLLESTHSSCFPLPQAFRLPFFPPAAMNPNRFLYFLQFLLRRFFLALFCDRRRGPRGAAAQGRIYTIIVSTQLRQRNHFPRNAHGFIRIIKP